MKDFSSAESGLPQLAGPACDRPCDGTQSFHCIFNWRIVNQTHDSTDGIPRHVTAVFDAEDDILSIPGPTIAVNVVSDLERFTTTMHRHGLPMRNTQYSDGGPGVTQCPVQPGQHFSWYIFLAENPGTYWYHGHTEFQRDDGLYGPIIIRDNAGGSCDMTEHSNLVQDWYYSTAEDRFFNNKDEKPISLLVNDDGRQYSDHSIARRPQP